MALVAGMSGSGLCRSYRSRQHECGKGNGGAKSSCLGSKGQFQHLHPLDVPWLCFQTRNDRPLVAAIGARAHAADTSNRAR